MINRFLTLNALHVLNDGLLASLPLLLPFVRKDLNIEFGKIGVLTGILGLSGVILALPATAVARRFGGLRTLFAAAFICSIAFVLTAMSMNFLFLGLSFIVAGIGFGVFHPISFSAVARLSPPKETGSRMGSFTAVGDIGRVGISAFVTVLVSLIDWRNTALVYAGFSAAVVLLLMLITPRPAEDSNTAAAAGPKPRGLRYDFAFISAIATCFIDSMASSTIFVFIPFLFVLRGASTAVIGSMTGAFFVGNMLGKVILGRLSDRVGNRRLFVVSEIAMSVLLVLMSIAENAYALAGISVLLGAVTKGTVPILNTLIAQAVPDKGLTEKAFGISALATGIAATSAPVLYGFIADSYSLVSVFHAAAVFALCAPIPLLLRKIHTSPRRAG